MAEVCVIGAGPAGSIFATRMAQLGHQVDLIERQRFPRAHLGKSLSPGVMPLLRAADMHETIEAAGFPSVTGVWVKWAAATDAAARIRARRVCWSTAANSIAACWRARAPSACGSISPRAFSNKPMMARNGISTVETDGASTQLDADFVADAGGRRGASRQRHTRTERRYAGGLWLLARGKACRPCRASKPARTAGTGAFRCPTAATTRWYSWILDQFRSASGDDNIGTLSAAARLLHADAGLPRR